MPATGQCSNVDTVTPTCNDNNSCTTDSCVPATGQCSNVDTVTPTCDDNNSCTTDSCVPATGQCSNVDTVTPTCNDNNSCTTDSCVPATGQCSNVDTVTPTCDDNNSCTTDSCVPATGQCSNVDTVTPTCNDNNSCTTDSCVPATGQCSNVDTVTPTCNDNNSCTTDSCNPATGDCVNSPPPSCDDNDACTVDSCSPTSGECEHSTPPSCDDNNACTTDSCDPATGQCVNNDTVTPTCDDNEVCTIDSCDQATGQCVNSPDTGNPACNPSECGDNASGPCVVTVDTPPGTFSSLQEAIDSAQDGATIHVTGVCVESVLIEKRNNLTIEGDAPTAEGCPPDGLTPADLTSTVKGGSQDLKDVIKVKNSMNILIRFLNVVDGGKSKTGVEFRTGMSNIAHCNCITRNKDGIEFDHHSKGTASKNLIFKNNRDGIWLHRCVLKTSLIMNTSRENLDDGIEIDDSCTESNLVTMNLVTKNVHDGIEVVDSDKNTIIVNEVTFNGISKSKDSGIELKPGTGAHGADDNLVNDNDIHDNSDMLVNLLNCKQNDGSGNTGNNVPPNTSKTKCQ